MTVFDLQIMSQISKLQTHKYVKRIPQIYHHEKLQIRIIVLIIDLFSKFKIIIYEIGLNRMKIFRKHKHSRARKNVVYISHLGSINLRIGNWIWQYMSFLLAWKCRWNVIRYRTDKKYLYLEYDHWIQLSVSHYK